MRETGRSSRYSAARRLCRPLAARAKNSEKCLLFGVLMPFAAGDEEAERTAKTHSRKALRLTAGLNGQNIWIELCWVG